MLHLGGSLWVADATAQGLKKVESENVRVLYPAPTEYVIPHVVRSYENAMRFHRRLFDYEPSEKTTLFVEDFGDFGNGGAGNIPRNTVLLGIAPFGHTYGADLFAERIFATMNHEAVHIVASDKAAGSDRFFRSFFGGKVVATPEDPVTILYSYLTAPRRYAPRWFHEGLAVFIETWMGGGLGRAMAGYDEMVFRTMVRDSAYIYDFVGLESEGTTVDFQTGANAYLYGTRFISYLTLQHGPDKLIGWVVRSDSSKKSYAAQFKAVYDATLDDEWTRWIEWERRWQQANLDSIRVNPPTPLRALAEEPFGSVSRAFLDPTTGKILLGVRRPGQLARLVAFDTATGRSRKIAEIAGPLKFAVSSVAFDAKSRNVFYTTDNTEWRDLHAVHVDTGERRLLHRNLRAGDLCVNPADQSLWGVRHYDGISTLIRLEAPYDDWRQIHSFPYGQDFYDIDISPSGTELIGALSDVSGRQLLVRANIDSLRSGQARFETLEDFDHSSPLNFVYSADGRHLYGSSYYTGVANLYRHDLERAETAIITNTESGLFRPLPLSADSLLAFSFTGGGFLPVTVPVVERDSVRATRFLGTEIARRYPAVRDWRVESPRTIDLDSLGVREGIYRPIRHVGFESWYPVVQGYKDRATLGIRVNLSDVINIATLSIAASVSPDASVPDDERFHLTATMRYLRWRVEAAHNRASFYDLFGPTKRSRKGSTLGLYYGRVLTNEDSYKLRYDLHAVGWTGLERLPFAQNIAASFSKLLSVGGSLTYSSLHRSLGAVDDEKGFRLSLVSENSLVNKKVYPQVQLNYDIGRPLPISHSSVWARLSGGLAVGERDEPFANFYFGGFGNNWVDHRDEKRYRLDHTFPGLEINEVGGLNYGRAMVEWNLPPVRFRRFGLPNFYFRWARPALFSSVLVTNVDSDADRQSLVNLGGQVDLQIVLVTRLTMTLSAGYSTVFEEGQARRDEVMVSLKIL